MSEENITYFACLYRLNGEDRYMIWISGEKDSVVLGSDGLIPTFSTTELLYRYANLKHYAVQSEEPILNDLDLVAAWAKAAKEPVCCQEVLNAWNLFGDIAVSIGNRGAAFRRLDPQASEVYNKVFRGNNLFSTTPERRKYIPQWSSDEIDRLHELLTAGLEMFEANTRSWTPE